MGGLACYESFVDEFGDLIKTTHSSNKNKSSFSSRDKSSICIALRNHLQLMILLQGLWNTHPLWVEGTHAKEAEGNHTKEATSCACIEDAFLITLTSLGFAPVWNVECKNTCFELNSWKMMRQFEPFS